MSTAVATWDDGKADYLKRLGDFIQYFQVNHPVNGSGLPLKLVNPVMLADKIIDYVTTDDVPDSVLYDATLTVDFSEGFPTVDGLPLWERLDGELVDYYNLFKQYREMLYVSGSRSIMKLASSSAHSGKHLNQLAKVYHWQLRCKAYDRYKEDQRNAERKFAIEKLETSHSRAAETLLNNAMDWLEKHPEQLNPKVALQMVQLGMKAGRLALGLNADSPGTSSGRGGNSGPTINIQQNNATDNGSIVSVQPGNTGDEDVNHLQSILHVLSESGAFDAMERKEVDGEIIEMEPNDE